MYTPLLRPLALRAAIAAALMAEGLAAVWVGWWWLLWLVSFQKFLVALAAAALAPLAAWPVLAGRWARGAWGAVQVVAVAGTLAIYAVVALAAGNRALDALGTRVSEGTPAADGAAWIALAAAATLTLAALTAVLPVPARRVAAFVAGGLATAALAGAGAAVAVAAGADSCERFRFDRARWRAASDREEMGSALIRCRTLEGRTRAEVRRALGRPGRQSGSWAWSLGWTNDLIGPGDEQLLLVDFGADDRVRSVRLLYPE